MVLYEYNVPKGEAENLINLKQYSKILILSQLKFQQLLDENKDAMKNKSQIVVDTPDRIITCQESRNR